MNIWDRMIQSAICGVCFGLYQNSIAAGVFMYGFTYIMQIKPTD